MEKFSSVKVSQTTLKKLHNMASKLSLIFGKRLNLDETIDSIIDIADKSAQVAKLEKEEIEKDRIEFLELLNKKIKGAGPEDYIPYDFNDVSSI